MAVAVASLDADLRARGLHKRDTPPRRIRSTESHGVQTGIRTLLGFWEDLTSSHEFNTRGRRWRRVVGKDGSRTVVLKQDVDAKVVPRELLRPYRTASLVDAVTSPPSYEESVQDVPPDYTVSAEY